MLLLSYKKKLMKKIFFVVLTLVSILGFAKQSPTPKSRNYNSSKTIIDTLKPDERKYNWYGKFLTRKEYLDTLSKKFKIFNDSLRKEQGL